jgi:hypothetical protein
MNDAEGCPDRVSLDVSCRLHGPRAVSADHWIRARRLRWAVARRVHRAPRQRPNTAGSHHRQQWRVVVDQLPAGEYEIACRLINFATARRNVVLGANGTLRVDIVLHFALNADVTVTAKHTFANLADVENPAEDLVGIAQAASQGAITAKQLDERPLMRNNEVLETVPGVIVRQHSGEGKANRYFLRGFNLDHGTDFATVVAGIPVNLPTHAHGQGYSDLNFLVLASVPRLALITASEG